MNDNPKIKVALVRSRAIDPAVHKIARALSQSGYSVDLLVWSREGKPSSSDNSRDYNVHSFNLKAPYFKPSLLFYLPLWWLYELYFLLKNRFDIIHACDLDTLFPAIIARIFKAAGLCYTIFDFYADILPVKVPGFIRKCAASMEKFGIGFTGVLFIVDETRYEQVKGARISRLEYIYNSPEDDMNPDNPAPAEDRVELEMFYAGYLGESRGIEAVIRAVGELDNISLTIAGTGEARDTIESEAAAKKNVTYLGLIPYEEVVKRTLKADILFAFYDPDNPSNRYASPNKLFEAMMSARPIIVNEGTTAGKIVRENNCGIVVPYGNVKAIQAAVKQLQTDASLRRALGTNGRHAYETRYSWEIMRRRLLNAYREMAGSV